jgi:HEAT repeat protein
MRNRKTEMRTRRIGFAIVLGLVLSVPLRGAAEAPDTSWLKPLDAALGTMLMTRQDLRFRADYEDPDPFRLPIVTYLMQNPLEVPEYSTLFAKELGKNQSIAGAINSSTYILSHANLPSPEGYFWNRPLPLWPTSRTQLKHSGDLPEPLRETVDSLAGRISQSALVLRSGWSALSLQELRFLQDSLPYFVKEQSDTREWEPDEQKRLESVFESLTARLMAAVNKTNVQNAHTSACILSSDITLCLKALKAIRPETLKKKGKFKTSAQGDVLFAEQTPEGEVIIGGPGKTIYPKRAALIIDFGGDDEYLAGAGGATPEMPVSVCIDLRGNDTYLSQEDFSQGSAFMGVGILVDCEGDDKYLGGSLSQGTGLLGVGLLWDQAGDDTYEGDLCCQGAGLWGIGILKDDKGNDHYNARIFSQGFGSCAGLGALLEGEGNDTYYVGGKYTDTIRYLDHYLTMSQGYAYGIRPDYSGGIGLIYDGKGNDTYVADIFGQGGSYWFGLGAIVDGEGNDRYLGYQYCQGSGIHLSLGALVDEAGDDSYLASTVSQGCGHDFAPGFLIDKSGNDNYQAAGLSQGAGNANGIGVLVDEKGDDSYSARDASSTQGHGNPLRDFGSVGVLLDFGGTDRYVGHGKEGGWWASGTWGMGWDLDSSSADFGRRKAEFLIPETKPQALRPPVLPPMRPPEPEPRDSLERLVDRLFNMTTSGLVKYNPLVKPSMDSLIALGGKAVPRLLEKLNTKNPLERNRLDELFAGIGAPSTPTLIRYLDRNDLRGLRSALYQLGKNGSAEALGPVLKYARHEDWRVRGAAIDALGRLKVEKQDESLRRNAILEALRDSVENVRRVAAYTLGEAKDSAAVPALISALEDDYYGTRHNAQTALVKIGDPARKALLERAGIRGQKPEIGKTIGRALAVQALSELKDDGPNPAIWFINDEDWMVRLAAVAGLDSTITLQEKTALKKQAEAENNPFVAQKIAQALTKPAARKAIPQRRRHG